MAEAELTECGVKILLEARVTEISKSDNALKVLIQQNSGKNEIKSRFVFNCTYSGLNHFSGDFQGTTTHLKHEITEMAVMQAPLILRNLGITVMDGPFFSMMPFPARGLHTLSHVRYTPHMNWKDHRDIDPYQKLKNYECTTRVDHMVRDVGRYLPAILDAKYMDSLFEVKTMLLKNEGDVIRYLVERSTISMMC
jgi:hypothetical protein